MSKYGNPRKAKFLAGIPQASLEADDDLLTVKCKFNFAYYAKQDASQSFQEWSHGDLAKLLDKLHEYSKQSLAHWSTTPCKSGHILEIYGAFPTKSDFTRPPHVPHQARWGRFRLENMVRLVGFVLPPELHDRAHQKTGRRFDCNTFYIVFLDREHRFYKTEAS